jgi:hypothetical protein
MNLKDYNGLSFADASKRIVNKYKKRDDKISLSSMERELSHLAEANETFKPKQPNQSFKYGGKLKQYEGGGQPWFRNNNTPPFIDNEALTPIQNVTMIDPLKNSNYRPTVPGYYPDAMQTLNSLPTITASGKTMPSEYSTGDPSLSTPDTSTADDKQFNTMTAGNYTGMATGLAATIADFTLAAKNKPRFVKNYFRNAMKPAINANRQALQSADRAITAEGRLALNKGLMDIGNNSLSNSSRLANVASMISNYNNQSGIGRSKLRSDFASRESQLLAQQGQLEGQGEFMRQDINTREQDAFLQGFSDSTRNLETRGYATAGLLNKDVTNKQYTDILKEMFRTYTLDNKGKITTKNR